MATKKRISKRLQITLSPESHKILCDFKAETGQSASSLIDEIITESTPMLKGLIEAHKRIAEGKKEGIEVFKETLHRAAEDISQVSMDFDKAVAKNSQPTR